MNNKIIQINGFNVTLWAPWILFILDLHTCQSILRFPYQIRFIFRNKHSKEIPKNLLIVCCWIVDMNEISFHYNKFNDANKIDWQFTMQTNFVFKMVNDLLNSVRLYENQRSAIMNRFNVRWWTFDRCSMPSYYSWPPLLHQPRNMFSHEYPKCNA